MQHRTAIPHSWIADLEHGHYLRPAPDRLALLARVLDVPLAEIDRILDGSLASQMPDWKLALQVTHDLTQAEINQVEDTVHGLLRNRSEDPERR